MFAFKYTIYVYQVYLNRIIGYWDNQDWAGYCKCA